MDYELEVAERNLGNLGSQEIKGDSAGNLEAEEGEKEKTSNS